MLAGAAKKRSRVPMKMSSLSLQLGERARAPRLSPAENQSFAGSAHEASAASTIGR